MSALTAYAEALIRGIASRMLDPHRYFEQRLLGELHQLPDEAAVQQFLDRLLDWLADGLLDAGQLQRLDAELNAQWLPSSRLAGAGPEILGILPPGLSAIDQALLRGAGQADAPAD